MLKGQDSRMHLELVSTGAEVGIDGPGALPSSPLDLWWPRQFSKDLQVCFTYILEHLEQMMQ